MSTGRVTLRDRFRGIVLGTAVGDTLGLPVEGLSRRRMRKWFGGDWNHRFALGRGMISDGVTGYVYHTVPVAIYSWYHHFGDFEATLVARNAIFLAIILLHGLRRLAPPY